jgi:DNA-binding NarL/FixJ family response regulator
MDVTKRIMLVDDNSCMLVGLRVIIDNEKPRMTVVSTVSTAGDVLTAVRQSHPDVIVLEPDLEGGAGLHLIGPIRDLCYAKFVAITRLRNSEALDSAILAGAHGLVLKFEPIAVVVKAIDAVLAGQYWVRRDAAARLLGIMTDRHRSDEEQQSTVIRLTPGERRVVAAAIKHKASPNKVIASELNMSAHTLRNHLSAIYGKLGVHCRLDMVLYGMRNGLAPAGDQNAAAERVPLHIVARQEPERRVTF